jgi:adenylate cyclase/guanylate cyclase
MAVIEGGAVVGFDVVFSDLDRAIRDFVRARPGHELRDLTDFLRALAVASQSGKIASANRTRSPHFAVTRSARGGWSDAQHPSSECIHDPDNVVRRAAHVRSRWRNGSSMSVELAARAQDVPPEYTRHGAVTLAGYRIPTAVPNAMTLNFEGGAGEIPRLLADLRACAEKGDTDFPISAER